MNQSKINQALKSKLFSEDTDTVLSTINKLKETGNQYYLPVLFDILIEEPEPAIEKEIMNLLATVKVKDTVPFFMDAILDEKYLSIKKKLLTVCWQNGLDYSGYLHPLIDIISTDDWEIAFEAFTLVDNMEELPEKSVVEEIIEKIKNNLNSASGKNEYFLNEILNNYTNLL